MVRIRPRAHGTFTSVAVWEHPTLVPDIQANFFVGICSFNKLVSEKEEGSNFLAILTPKWSPNNFWAITGVEAHDE